MVSVLARRAIKAAMDGIRRGCDMKEMKKTALTLNVNRETYDVVSYPNRTLLEVPVTISTSPDERGLW